MRQTVCRAVDGVLVGALVLSSVCSAADSNPDPRHKLPAVEFTEVAGETCLQPIVYDSQATFADYRDAEMRWLTNKRPGTTAREWQLVAELGPPDATSGEAQKLTTRRETVHLDGIVGPDATVCFDINLTEETTVRGDD